MGINEVRRRAQMQQEIKFLQLAESYGHGTEQGLKLSHRQNIDYLGKDMDIISSIVRN